jgi:hypothetical protein
MPHLPIGAVRGYRLGILAQQAGEQLYRLAVDLRG